MTNNSGEERTLTLGAVLVATPCVVTIDFLPGSGASGWCASCSDRHLIDRPLYESGRGPWREEPTGRSGDAGAHDASRVQAGHGLIEETK